MIEKSERQKAMEKTRDHWEMDVSDSVFPKARKSEPMDDFLAKPAYEWPSTHVKINECDN